MPAVKCVTPRRVSATQGTGPKGGTLRTAIQSQAQTGGCAELERVGDWRQSAFPGPGEEGLCRWGEGAEHGSCGPLVSPGDLHPLHFRHPIGSSPGCCGLRKVLCEDVEDQEARRMRTTTVRAASPSLSTPKWAFCCHEPLRTGVEGLHRPHLFRVKEPPLRRNNREGKHRLYIQFRKTRK